MECVTAPFIGPIFSESSLPAISPLQITTWRIICRKTSNRNPGVIRGFCSPYVWLDSNVKSCSSNLYIKPFSRIFGPQPLPAGSDMTRYPCANPVFFPPSTWSVQSGASYEIWNRRWFPPDYCNSHPFPGLKLLPSSVAPNIQTSSDSNDQKYRTFSLVKAIISRWSFLSLQGKKW